ncbi:hypothetical protein ACIPUC_31615 [Streptomyces sp. LARHCF249]
MRMRLRGVHSVGGIALRRRLQRLRLRGSARLDQLRHPGQLGIGSEPGRFDDEAAHMTIRFRIAALAVATATLHLLGRHHPGHVVAPSGAGSRQRLPAPGPASLSSLQFLEGLEAVGLNGLEVDEEIITRLTPPSLPTPDRRGDSRP